MCCTKAFADVLRQFDLGGTTLDPVPVYEYDRNTRIEGEFFVINFNEQKDTFRIENLPESYGDNGIIRHTRGKKSGEEGYIPTRFSGSWGSGEEVKKQAVPLLKEALEGPDLWTEKSLPRGVFMSDRLVQALRAAKVHRNLSLDRCVIVD